MMFRSIAQPLAIIALAASVALAGEPTALDWRQWGGPHRNFISASTGLADAWPEDGPPVIWKRDLGDGYSSIAVDEGVLYTMYRKGAQEFAVALDARDGHTLWEHGNPSPLTQQMQYYGPGPHSTPLIVDQRVFTAGANADLFCFDKKSGRLIWQHDLLIERQLIVPTYGYAASAIAYGDTVIFPVMGDSNTPRTWVTAFDQADGRVIWNAELPRRYSEQSEFSSPILIRFDGEDQLVYLTNEVVVGLNPRDGEVLWSIPHPNRQGVNITTPVWDGRDRLFCSGAYDSGAQGIRLKKENGKTVAEQLWSSRKLRIHQGTAILVGDTIYASSGDFGPAFFTAMNLQTGEAIWRERGFKKVNSLYADGKLIMLDEDGVLALARVSPEKFELLSRCQLTSRISWTVPTLVDTTLYVRDRRQIMALNLGR